MQNGLSVDVEDWFQVGAFERTIDRADWPRLECRVEANCDAVLRLFDEAQKRHQFGGIVAIAVGTAIGRRDDPLAFIETDARGADAGGLGDFSDFHDEGP